MKGSKELRLKQQQICWSNINSCKGILEGVLPLVLPELVVESFEGGLVKENKKNSLVKEVFGG